MFNNLKIVLISSNEMLVYNNIVAGLFNDYRVTSDSAIHQLENRKLDENEIDEFIEQLSSVEECDDASSDEIIDIMNKITKICPEVRYVIHGLKMALAATPEQMRKKRLAKKEKRKQVKKERATDKATRKEPTTEDITKERVKKTEEEKRKKSVEKEESSEKTRKEEEQKKIDNEKGDGEEVKEGEEGKEEKEKKEKIEEEKTTLKKDTKTNNPFTGFKGLMFDMFNVFLTEDPEKKKNKEKLQRQLRKEWSAYKKNEKLFEKNEKLIEQLMEGRESGEITPESVSLLNEFLAENPEFIKEIDLSDKRKHAVTFSLENFKPDIKEKLKDVNLDIDSKLLEQEIRDILRKEGIKIKSITIDEPKKDGQGNPVDGGKRVVDVELEDWDSFFKFGSRCVDLEVDDLA